MANTRGVARLGMLALGATTVYQHSIKGSQRVKYAVITPWWARRYLPQLGAEADNSRS